MSTAKSRAVQEYINQHPEASQAAIARAFDRTPSSICQMIKRHGLNYQKKHRFSAPISVYPKLKQYADTSEVGLLKAYVEYRKRKAPSAAVTTTECTRNNNASPV